MSYAKNGLKPDINIEARELYEERLKNASFYITDDDNLLNIWSNASQKYGRVDLNNYVIYPKESKMTHYGEAKVFDFVAEMLEELYQFSKTSILMQTLDPDRGLLFPLEFVSGYISPHAAHLSYLQRKTTGFIKSTNENEEDKKILDYEDFQKSFLSFVERTEKRTLLSKSKYYSSNVGSPSMSGLFVETKALSHADDSHKVTIIEDNNFAYFVEAARRHGFFVDMNAPWRLVVDIRSCYVRTKLKQRGINNTLEFFQEYYIPSYSVDFKNIKELFFSLWNSYCDIRPYVDTLRDTQYGFGMAVSEREKVSNIDNISKLQWSKLYITIRVKETLRTSVNEYITDLLKEVEFYFDEEDWEEKVAKHVEKKLIRKVSKKGLTSAANMYRIIEQDCPEPPPEVEPEDERCTLDNNAMKPEAPYEEPEEVVFPDFVENNINPRTTSPGQSTMAREPVQQTDPTESTDESPMTDADRERR